MSKKTISVSVIVSLFIGMLATFGIVTPAYAAVAPTPSEMNTVRTHILNATNQARAQQGLPPVVMNSSLNTVAQNCSAQQATNNTMAHCDGFQNNYPAGWYAAGENVAYGYSYTQVFDAWMNSSGHRANILSGSFTDLGIGYYFSDSGIPYYTQNFGGYTSTKTIPGAVRNVDAVAQANGSVNVLFQAPTYNGNSAITSYTITASANGQANVVRNVSTAGTHNITGLRPGIAWTISVVANNANGSGVAAPSDTVTPVGPPSLTIGSIDVTSTTGQVNFSVADNGAPVTSITVTPNGQAPISIPTNSQWYLFSDLRPGTTYAGTVNVTNSNGTTSTPFSFETLAVAPDAPSTNVVVEGINKLKVSWTAPGFDGGAAVTNYNVSLYDVTDALVTSVSVAGNVRTHTFNDLVRGQEYTVRVEAVNRVGNSTSNPQTLTVPYTAPTVPLNVTGELSDEVQVTLKWDAPTDNGGIDISNYKVQVFANSELQNTITVNATAATNYSRVINGLDPATLYTFRVIAVNHAGLESPAGVSNAINVPAVPVAPDAVENIQATNVVNDGFTVTWDAPTNNGGAAVENYTYQISDESGVLENGTTTDTTVTLGSLQRYTQYSVVIKAVNYKGESPEATVNVRTLADAPSVPFVSDVQPLSPTSVRLEVRSINDGGDSNITYTVKAYKNGSLVSTEQSTNGTVEFDGLEVNTDYTIDIVATNSGGSSNPGASSFSTPATSGPVTFDTPEVVRYSATNSWNAPADTGSYPIEGYFVTYLDSEGEVISITRVNADTLTSEAETTENGVFRDGQTYTIRVTPLTYSTDLEGESAETTFTFLPVAPYAAKNVTASAEGRTVTATWDAPTNNGGAAVENYVATLYSGNNIVTVSTVTETEVTFPISNPNTDYHVTVLPRNSVGTNVNSISTSNVVNSGAFPPAAPVVETEVNENTGVVTAEFSVTDTGGSAVTRWEYRSYVTGETPGNWTSTVANNASFTGANGKTYILEVRAYNTAGGSPMTSTNVEIPVIAPKAVENLNATASGTTVNATWTLPSFNGGANLTSVNVVVKDASGAVVYDENLAASATSVSVADLDAFSDYTVEVTVTNASGLTSPVAEDSVKTEPGIAPVATDVTISHTGRTVNVDLTPGQVNNPELQELVRSTVRIYNAENDTLVYTTTSNNGAFFTGEYGTTYYATVTSSYFGWANSSSAAVTTGEVQIPAIAPSPVTNLTVAFDRLDATVSWTPGFNGGATQEFVVTVVEEGAQDGFSEVTTGSSVEVLGLKANTEYVVTVTPRNSAGSGTVVSDTFQTATVEPTEARNLTGSASGTTVSYDWDAPSDNGGGTVVYDYTLYNSANAVVTSGVTNETSFSTSTSIVRGETYRLAVTARNSAGSAESVTSAGVWVTPIAPNTATNVKATDDGNNNITLTWDAPSYNGGSPVTGYVVATPEGNVNVTGRTITLSQEAYGFEPATDYVFSVAAVNAYGVSPAVEAEITTSVIVPGAPVVSLSYNDDASALTINYVAGSNGGETNTFTVNVTRNGVDYYNAPIDGTETIQVTRGAEYVVTVVAKNSAGETSSAPRSYNVAAIAPEAPINVTYTLSDENEFVGTWDAPNYDGGAEITGYNWTVTNDEDEVVDSGTVTETNVAVTLPANQELTFRVAAVNSAGVSPLSVPVNFTTNILTPSGLTVDVDVTASTATFTGQVEDNGGAEIVEETWTVRDGDNNVIASGTGNTFTATELTHATVYTVEYTASNGGSAPASTVVEFKTSPIAPVAPENVKAEVADATSVKVTWDAPTDNGGADVTGYIVKFADQSNTHVGTVNATGTSATVTGLNLGSTYTFTVVAVNSAGESQASVASNAVKTAPANKPTPLTEEMLLENWDSFNEIDVELNGDLLTVTDLPEDTLESWLGAYGYSEPTWLGWAYNANGTVVYNVSALAAGDHTLAVYDEAGNVVGVATFTIPAEPTNGGSTPGTSNNVGNGNTSGNNSNNSNNTNVEQTGQDTAGWLYLGGGFLLIAFATAMFIRRRKPELAEVKVED